MIWQRILRRGEGQIWFAGLMLWALLLVEVVAAWLADARVGRGMAIGIAAEIVFGREGGIPVALQGGVPRFLVFQTSATQDIASALVIYPLFLLALHHWHERDNYLMRRVRRIEAVAARHETYVHRWGPLGIAVFMLMPFVVNGPMVGLIVGRLAGIYTRHVLPAVVIATVISAAAWTFFFDAMIVFAERFDGRGGLYVVGFMVLVVLSLASVDYLRERRQRTLEDDEPEPVA